MQLLQAAPVLATRRDSEAELSRVCCVMVHGFNALPTEFDSLAVRLMARGSACRILHLPGDGGSRTAWAASRWSDWHSTLRTTGDEAARRYPSVMLIGHSLGAALALRMAAGNPGVAGVVALCPPLRMWPGEAFAIHTIRHLMPYLPAWPVDITAERRNRCAAVGHDHAYMPVGPLASFFRALPDVRHHLTEVTCPALIVCARHDHVVPARDGMEVFSRLSSAQKRLLVLARSFHSVLHDVEQDLVERAIEAFCLEVSA